MNINKLNHNTTKRYSSKNKSLMVEEIRSGMLSIKQSSRQYQITGSVLQQWNRWYFKTKLLKYFSPNKFVDMNPAEEAHQLRQRIKMLQAELEQLQLKNKALETMIAVAEKELKIDIRKKPGSKQSDS
jgi:transposase